MRRDARTIAWQGLSAAGARLCVAGLGAWLVLRGQGTVGTLVAVGGGRIPAPSMPTVLAARDRSAAGTVAPPHGLTLVRVRYGRRSLTGSRLGR